MLDGAQALALPTQLGQRLSLFAQYTQTPTLHWRSLEANGQSWFEGQWAPTEKRWIKHSDEATAARLSQLLDQAIDARPEWTQFFKGCLLQTQATFPRHWGLGTSSTLIHAFAHLTQLDPYELLAQSFGGSGYDIACAGAEGPILYQRIKGKPSVQSAAFQPPFVDQLYFVYLGKKQNSREGIARYRSLARPTAAELATVTQMTHAFLKAQTLGEFEATIEAHENFIAQRLKLKRAHTLYFSDYWGKSKSLGAWGGDFVLLTNSRSFEALQQYCSQKGLTTVIPYRKLIRSKD